MNRLDEIRERLDNGNNTPEDITYLLAENDKLRGELKESGNHRFYYCESQNEYLLGHRVGNFYYAHWYPP